MPIKRQRIGGSELETEVLWRCRRRCAFCFGLQNDTGQKHGQIAHVNKNRNDDRVENLAFLCLEHHDQYDSTTSQSKNLTRKELIRYRDELHQSVNTQSIFAFNDDRQINATSKPPSGLFARKSGIDGGANIAFFKVRKNWDGRPVYLFLGRSFEGTQRQFGPNMGFLSFEVVDDGQWPSEYSEGDYQIMFGFESGRFLVEEENEFSFFGAGAHFFGEYERIYSPVAILRWWLCAQYLSKLRKGKWPD